MQKKNIGWESGQQKRASANVPELKESLQLKWHDMEDKWPTDQDVAGFETYSKVNHRMTAGAAYISNPVQHMSHTPSST